MDKKYLGIREIAKLAGVSTATVSRVLNSPEKTTEESRKKVLKVVEEYDYVPNQAAKNLFSGHSDSIAVFVYDMTNPYYIQFIKQLNAIAFDNNYTLLVCDAEDSQERELRYLNYCKSIRISGIVYTAGSTRDLIGNIGKNLEFPIVTIDRREFKDKDCYTIKSDHKTGMKLLVDHLVELNHKKIGFITGPMTVVSARERLESFLDAMDSQELEVPEHYIKRGGYSIAGGVDACDYFEKLEDRPTAIIASNDQSAQGFVIRANMLGLSVPGDFSVCGFDGALTESYFDITSVVQDVKKITETAFDCIVNDGKKPVDKNHIVDVMLKIGNTTARI